MRYGNQPLESIYRMTERDFRFALMTACYWRSKEVEASATGEEA